MLPGCCPVAVEPAIRRQVTALRPIGGGARVSDDRGQGGVGGQGLQDVHPSGFGAVAGGETEQAVDEFVARRRGSGALGQARWLKRRCRYSETIRTFWMVGVPPAMAQPWESRRRRSMPYSSL